jgi:hypothetical protein
MHVLTNDISVGKVFTLDLNYLQIVANFKGSIKHQNSNIF